MDVSSCVSHHLTPLPLDNIETLFYGKSRQRNVPRTGTNVFSATAWTILAEANGIIIHKRLVSRGIMFLPEIVRDVHRNS